MKFTTKLAGFLQDRTVKEGSTWGYGKAYKEAVKRVEDHTADKQNPYWHAPSAGYDAMPGDNEIFDETGSSRTIKEAREEAMEILVLCDVWEANQQ